tara:strand:+ start:148 stop:549 length:402 start_codon:yes stop_codon:yes gene_type:complete
MKNQNQGQPPAPQYQSGKRNNFTGIASNPNGNVMSSTQQIRGAPPSAQAARGNMAGAMGGALPPQQSTPQAGGLLQQQQAQAIRQQPNATNRGSQRNAAMGKSMWEKALNTPEGKEQIAKSMAGMRGQAPINN